MNNEQVGYRSPSYYELDRPVESDWRTHRPPEYWAYRRRWDERPLERNPGEFPLHLDVETTNACNLRCSMCPRTHYLKTGNKKWSPGGKIGFMDFGLYRRVIDQGAAEGCFSVKLNFLGEPLVHPQVIDQVAYAKGRGLEVMMNTNATLLSETMAQNLLDAGVDDVFFSVDSPYPRQYEGIRVGAEFEKVMANIGRFMEIKDRSGCDHVQTRASMVIASLDEDSRQIREDYTRLFTSLGVAEIGFGLPTEMETDYWAEYGRIPGFVCRDIYQRLFVYWDGLVGPCCGHWERGLIMGDALTQSLKEIWHNEMYARLRSAHEAGRYETIDICRQCSVPWLSAQEPPS